MADKLDPLALLKANLGVTTNTRDPYLQSILDSVSNELIEGKGLTLTSAESTMFLVDYAAWRFRNRSEGTMPRDLQFRLHNLMIQAGEPNA